MFEQIYHEYLVHKNEQNTKERYKGNESWYHASGAGFCSRKLYFESVEKATPTNPPNKQSTRVMGLGTAIHNEIQSSLLYYNNINTEYNNTAIDNKDIDNSVNIVQHKRYNFHVEREIVIEDLNVRGFYDVVVEDHVNSEKDPLIRLYDIKSTGSYGFKKQFSAKFVNEDPMTYFMQLSTYGLAVKEKYGHLDSMDLIYYNKDDSRMKKLSVDLSYLSKARRYWSVINDEHAKGLPLFNLGTSPYKEWMCNYCQFLDHCKPPKFK
jgi:CRISPR/Cas system-associated exonuclease Cas4 (RecB family)